jgi:hypothetical protein
MSSGFWTLTMFTSTSSSTEARSIRPIVLRHSLHPDPGTLISILDQRLFKSIACPLVPTCSSQGQLTMRAMRVGVCATTHRLLAPQMRASPMFTWRLPATELPTFGRPYAQKTELSSVWDTAQTTPTWREQI